MERQTGLRERKKARTRQHIADTAARLFAAHGFDRVSIVDVARVAEVSDHSVYNYFPTKQDLVLDRAEEVRERYSRTVVGRTGGVSPAAALRAVAREDIERPRRADLDLARGEFPALCVSSPSIRLFALEAHDQQAEPVAAAITETSPVIHQRQKDRCSPGEQWQPARLRDAHQAAGLVRRHRFHRCRRGDRAGR
jgi:AcrR family transcriptional regulator